MSSIGTVVLAHYDSDALSTWRSELETEGFKVLATSSGRDVVGRVETAHAEAVVLDVLLPKMNGLQVLKELKGRPGGPVVVTVVDDGDTYTENRALICGADAILKRGADGRLVPGALGAKLRSLIAEAAVLGRPGDADDPLQRILDGARAGGHGENPVLTHITDDVTGLFNADYLAIKLAEEFKRARRFRVPLTFVLLEARAGEGRHEPEHDEAWRHALNEIAGLLLCESRDIDILARSSSDSFVLLLPQTPVEGARVMTERVLEGIAARELGSEKGERLVARAGIASFSGDDLESGDELAERAATAVAAAWRGTGKAVIWSAADGV